MMLDAAELSTLAEKLAQICISDGACAQRLQAVLSQISGGTYPKGSTAFQDTIAEITGEPRGSLDEAAACAIFHTAQQLFIGSMHVFFIPEEHQTGSPMPVLRTCPNQGATTPNKGEAPLIPNPRCEEWAVRFAQLTLTDAAARDWFLASFDSLAELQKGFVAKLQELLQPELSGYQLRIVDAKAIFQSAQSHFKDQRFVYFVPDQGATIEYGMHNMRGVPTDQLADS